MMRTGASFFEDHDGFQGPGLRLGERNLASDPGEEAEAVLRLIAEPVRAATLGMAARKRMEQRYAWAATLSPLRDIVLGEAS